MNHMINRKDVYEGRVLKFGAFKNDAAPFHSGMTGYQYGPWQTWEEVTHCQELAHTFSIFL